MITMAASPSNAPEEARPPESQPYRKKYHSSSVNNNSLTTNNNTRQCIESNVVVVPQQQQRSTRIAGLRHVLFPKNKRKISCITSTDSERNLSDLSIIQVPKEASVVNKSPVGVVVVPPDANQRPKTRHSVHLDVDEALSSLLWQPYEYQNLNNNNNNSNLDRYSLSSYDNDSSYRCSTDSSHNDLATTTATKFGTNNSSTCCNNANSLFCSSNRRRSSSAVVEGVNAAAQHTDELTLNVAYLTAVDSLCSYAAHNSVTAAAAARSPLYQQQYIHGAHPNGNGTMVPALVPPPSSCAPLLPTLPPRPHNTNSNIVEISSTANNVHPNMVLPLGSTGHGSAASAAASLHTANVVGLPSQQHSRQSSIPCGSAVVGTRGGSTSAVIFPNHPRTASEPIQQRYYQHIRTSANSTLINDLMTGALLKNDFNTPQQRAPLDLSIHGGTTTNEHLNIVHRMVPPHNVEGINKPQLSITHQRIPSDFNGTRGGDNSTCSSSTAAAMVSSSSQLHITHQRTVSDIAQSSTVRNDAINKAIAVAATPPRIGTDINCRMVPEITNAVVQHQRSSSIPNNSKKPASSNNNSGILNVSNVNVNYYRAVPVNVVSAVPTIHCVNTNEHTNGSSTTTNTNISNVNIIQAMPSSTTSTSNINKSSHSVSTTTLNNNDNNNGGTTCTEVIVYGTQEPPIAPPRLLPPSTTSTRTFTSTEAQTDEIITAAADINAITSSSGTQQQQQNSSTSGGGGGVVLLDPAAKEQRRRERRERKHQRRMNNVNHRHSTTNQQPAAVQGGTASIEQWSGSTQTNDRLPDILNSHLPPPYSSTTGTTSLATGPPPPPATFVGYHPHHHNHHQHGVLPQQGLSGSGAGGVVVPPGGGALVPPGTMGFHHGPVLTPAGAVGQVQVPGSAVHHHAVHQGVPLAVPVVPSNGFRFPFATTGFRRSRYSDDHPPKGCCGILSWKPGSLRWFIALIALVAVCCVLVGTALGAMRPAGRDHLTVSLLMIGVGIVLVTVSAIAWRLTSHSPTTSCRSMFGLSPSHSTLSLSNPQQAHCGPTSGGNSRRFIPRLPPAYGGGNRPHHPYAAMLYPEFQYRAPPPTYQASMQEYRLRLLLLDRVGMMPGGGGQGVVASPPPTYRSGYTGGGDGGSSIIGAGSLLRSTLSHRRTLPGQGNCAPPIIDLAQIQQHATNHRSGGDSAGNTVRGGSRPASSQQHQHIVLHSRDHSLTLSEPVQVQVHQSLGRNGGVNVVSILNEGGGDGGGGGVRLLMNGEGGCYEVVGDLGVDVGVDDIKLDGGPLEDPADISDLVAVTTSSKPSNPDLKDNGGNLVTIVQTGDDQSPVIVTVSGGNLHHNHMLSNGNMVSHRHHHHHHQLQHQQQQMQITEIGASDGSMEILAHL